MSDAMWPIYLVLGMFAVIGVVAVWEYLQLPGSIIWRAQRTLRRHIERLGRESTAELVARARKEIHAERWEGFGPARALVERDDWTDEALLRALEDLYAALSADDRAKGRSARGGAVFEFYDCGLASICDALKKRLPSGGSRT